LEVFGKFLRGIQRFMAEQGYQSIEDFRGMTLPYITTVEQLAHQPRKIAVLDQELCTKCGLCAKICSYDALDLNERLQVNPVACDGCGLCVEMCPAEALSLGDPQ